MSVWCAFDAPEPVINLIGSKIRKDKLQTYQVVAEEDGGLEWQGIVAKSFSEWLADIQGMDGTIAIPVPGSDSWASVNRVEVCKDTKTVYLIFNACFTLAV